MSSLAEQLAARKNKLVPTTTVVTHMYQIFSTDSAVDDSKAGAVTSTNTATIGVAASGSGGAALDPSVKPKPLRFFPRANKTLSAQAQSTRVIRCAFFSSEIGPDMRFDRICVSLKDDLSDRFTMEQIDPTLIANGCLFTASSGWGGGGDSKTAAAAAGSSGAKSTTASDLRYDVIIFPGGAVWEEQASITDSVARELTAFVYRGGGWWGTCAGAFLATSDGFSAAKTERALLSAGTSWAPGQGQSVCTLTPAGHQIFGIPPTNSGTVQWFFANGPTFSPHKPASSDVRSNRLLLKYPGIEKDVPISNGEVLAYYQFIKTDKTDWTFPAAADSNKDSKQTAAANAPHHWSYPAAALCGTFGAGRIVCFGPHPEGIVLARVSLCRNRDVLICVFRCDVM